MTVAIVCVGNRLVPEDALGPRVFERLRAAAGEGAIERGIALVDGGLRGLDLLPEIERASHVVFVDAVLLDEPGAIVELAGDAGIALDDAEGRYDHAAGLAYLLRALPHVCEGAPPSWELVGAAGAPDDALVSSVAAQALALARRRAEASS